MLGLSRNKLYCFDCAGAMFHPVCCDERHLSTFFGRCYFFAMSDPREEIAKALSNWMTPDQTAKLVDEVLAITKRASAEFDCKKCGQRQMRWTDIPDAKAVASALTDLSNQAFGRPLEASAHQDPVKFVRLTNLAEVEELKRG